MRRLRPSVRSSLGLLCVTAAASATPPGKNGKLAFRRWFNPQHTWGAVFTADPDGSAVRQITHPRKFAADVEPDWSPNGTRIVFQRIDVNGCGGGCETDEIDVVCERRLAPDEARVRPAREGVHQGRQPAGGRHLPFRSGLVAGRQADRLPVPGSAVARRSRATAESA